MTNPPPTPNTPAAPAPTSVPASTPGAAPVLKAPDPAAARGRAALFGMKWFLASLSMLFLASIIGYAVIRSYGETAAATGQTPSGDLYSDVPIPSSMLTQRKASARADYSVPPWKSPGQPELPATLWISTVLIVLSSAALRMGELAIRRGNITGLKISLTATLALGLGFLICQALNWFELQAAYAAVRSMWTLHAFTFYMLTGLHGAHVIGGIIPMGITWSRSLRGAYRAEAHVGVQMVAMYWHYLGVVWLVLFALISF